MRGPKQSKKRSGGVRSRVMIEAGLAPTPERLRHGPVIRHKRQHEDGAAAMVWQGLDTIGAMLARGSITSGMHLAGAHFHDMFQLAGLDPMWSADPTRVPVQLAGAGVWANGRGSEAARLQIVSALDALGGINSPGGSCAWHILGCEMSLRRWSMTIATWATRRLDPATASGILIADLGVLEAHWFPDRRLTI
jgi:hypothetical protein